MAVHYTHRQAIFRAFIMYFSVINLLTAYVALCVGAPTASVDILLPSTCDHAPAHSGAKASHSANDTLCAHATELIRHWGLKRHLTMTASYPNLVTVGRLSLLSGRIHSLSYRLRLGPGVFVSMVFVRHDPRRHWEPGNVIMEPKRPGDPEGMAFRMTLQNPVEIGFFLAPNGDHDVNLWGDVWLWSVGP